jgi:hypothetical protein
MDRECRWFGFVLSQFSEAGHETPGTQGENALNATIASDVVYVSP